MKNITLLMASNYTYGPPMDSSAKKEYVEGDINNKISRSKEGGFVVSCKILGGGVNDDGVFRFDEVFWNKVFDAETNGRGTKREGVDIENRVKFLLDAVRDPNQQIIHNIGGGHLATDFLLQEMIKQIDEMAEDFKPTPTVFFGFSDGTALPFYLSSKYDNLKLVQSPSIDDLDYLSGKKVIEAQLELIGDSRIPSEDIEADLVAISLHASYDQICKRRLVDRSFFDGNIVALESARDEGWLGKLEGMIRSGALDNVRAVILGEFIAGVEGEVDSYGFKGDDFDKEGSVKFMHDQFYTEFTEKLLDRNSNILVYKASGEHALFGHGCGRREPIACSKSKITVDGKFINSNPISNLRVKPNTSVNPRDKTASFESSDKPLHL